MDVLYCIGLGRARVSTVETNSVVVVMEDEKVDVGIDLIKRENVKFLKSRDSTDRICSVK